MRRVFLISLLLIAILMTGCHSNAPVTETTNSTIAPAGESTTGTLPPDPITQKQMFSVMMPVITESETADDGTVLFNYNYQNMALIVPEPELADKIIVNYLNRIDSSRATAANLLQQAQNNYSAQGNWIAYGYSVIYNPTRIDQSVLSLVGTNISYSGGSHPNYDCISANYDMITGEVLTLGSILTHEDVLPALQQLLIDALDAIAEEKYIRDGYQKIIAQRFANDVSFDEAWYFSTGGLCFYYSPYEIAPYSSGEIHVEIPYEALTGIILDDYFPAEQDQVSGVLAVQLFDKADLTQFTQIAELILDKESQKSLIFTDRVIEDVFITDVDPISGNIRTIFATDCLTPGDAVMIEATDETLKNLMVKYTSGNSQMETALTSE